MSDFKMIDCPEDLRVSIGKKLVAIAFEELKIIFSDYCDIQDGVTAILRAFGAVRQELEPRKKELQKKFNVDYVSGLGEAADYVATALIAGADHDSFDPQCGAAFRIRLFAKAQSALHVAANLNMAMDGDLSSDDSGYSGLAITGMEN